MFKLFFVYLLLIHLLGDYYFQTEKLASEKNRSVEKLLHHGSIYLIVSLVGIIPIFNKGTLIAAIILSISHFSVDFMKYYYIKTRLNDKYQAQKGREIYLLDQFLHIVCIFVIALLLTSKQISLTFIPIFDTLFEIIEIPAIVPLFWSTIFLLIWKPANITIKQVLYLYKPSEGEQEKEKSEVEESSKKTGGFIGLLERLIILILLSINQYSAIGLVLTAKSIARYNKISENKEFAEYYLLGTLMSTAIVIGAYIILA